LEQEGISIHYDDDVNLVPLAFTDNTKTLVVYTPAIPADNSEYNYFVKQGFTIQKRAQVLGEVTRIERGLCVAGTHGKTTTSTMTAHLLKQSHVDCNAFLGGISKNYTSNLLLSDKSDLVVIEADEFDRSFHHLTPYMAVVTAVDADHLDIGAILLECSDLPPYAAALHRETGLPVFDFTTLINWVHSAVVRREFYGYM
jgi:UDP-N-acetylmuramate--alanine ligase